MSNILLDISEKISPAAVEILSAVSEVCNRHEIPFVVVGGSARDIVLHYGYGAPVRRATDDIDFGVQVPSWSAFKVLKAELQEKGFKETGAAHKLISPSNLQLDIVPFGGLESDGATIEWPPKGDVVMSVLGFREACETAEIVRIQSEPQVDVPVATPPGLAVLKLIAWMDRNVDRRQRDAKDMAYLFTTYSRVPSIGDQLHEDQALMEKYDWDMDLSASHELGIRAKAIASDEAINGITALLEDRHPKLSRERLVEEMCENIEREFERNETLFMAFSEGFTQ